jgi:hypothetical protein
MPRYGVNIEDYFEHKKVDRNMSKASILDVGSAVLKMLQTTHEAGFVYNDLKLDNLMAGFETKLTTNVTNESIF